DEAGLDKRTERDPRLRPLATRNVQSRFRDGLNRRNARGRNLDVGGLPFDADEVTSEALGNSAGRAGAEERIEDHILRFRRRQKNAVEQRLGLLCRVRLGAVAVLEALA